MALNFGISAWKGTSGGGGGGSVGSAVSASGDGVHPNFIIAFGSPPASGTWVYMIVQSVTGVGTPVGGSAWTQIDTGSSANGVFLWVKQCGGSEPANYTVTYSGSAKVDGATASMIEILGVNATNPDSHSVNLTGTGTSPSATSSNAADIAIVGWGGSLGVPTAPSGYTLQTSLADGVSNTVTAIATKTSVGTGTITPPAWGVGSSATECVSTCLFMP